MRITLGRVVSSGCSFLFLAPFCAVGVGTAVAAIFNAVRGDWALAGFVSIFALTFGGVGFGLLALLLHVRRREREERQLQAAYPNESWMWKAEWANGRIQSASRATLIARWVFAFFWNLISAPLAVTAVPKMLAEGNRTVIAVLLFPAFGLILLALAVRETLRYRRFGVSVLRLAAVPIPLGRALRGVIITRAAMMPPNGFSLRLACLNRVTRRVGGKTEITERTLWEDRRTVPRARGDGSATAIPVGFIIPRDTPATTPADEANEIVWRLEAEAIMPGVDYAAQFELPVFETAESDVPLSREEREAAEAYVEVVDGLSPSSGISVTEGLRRTEIHFAPARNVLPALITTAIAVVVALVWWSLPRDEIPIVFQIFFGGFGLIFALGLVNLWLRTTRVLVDPYTITIRASYLGLGRTRVIPADEIEDITVGLGTRSGRSNWYDIAVVTRAGKRYRAGGSLPKKKEAEWIAEQMRRALGL